jgi:hypothetical protein
VGDAIITFLAVLVGAAASLAGTVLVNRWELRRAAKFRMYQELIPKIKSEVWPAEGWKLVGEREFKRSLHALERAAAAAGPLEWRCAVMARIHAEGYLGVLQQGVPDSEAVRQEREKKLEAEFTSFYKALDQLDHMLRDQVRTLWPIRRLRLRAQTRKLLRRQKAQGHS